jgi:predicted TIM-barrel fold metal-dependent hydrolase
MDEQGIDVTVLYPSLGLNWQSECDDASLAAAHCRVYNNWIAAFCEGYPRRLIPAASISLMDVDEGIKEIKRAVKLGIGGVYLFPNPTNGIHYGDAYYDPFWAEVQDLGLPIGIHVSSTPNYIGHHLIRDAGFNNNTWFFSLAQKMDCQLCFMQFFQGAVFDRFPTLKVGVVESGCTWIAHRLDSMDAFAKGDTSTSMKLRPSEYFERQCWITGEADERAFSAMARVIGAERLHWGSDYPHEEGHAEPVKMIGQCLGDLSTEDRRLIFGENACALYNLN